MPETEPTHIDDLNTALMIAAQNLAAAAIQRAGAAEQRRIGDSYDTGGRLQVSIELPSLCVSVIHVDGESKPRAIYTAVLQSAAASASRNPSSRLN